MQRAGLTISLCASLWATHAVAAPFALRANIAPGVSTLSPPNDNQRAWGWAVGASLGIGVSDLAWVQLLVDHAELGKQTLPRRLTAFGGSLVYTIDVGTVTPFLEGGIGYVQLRGTRGLLDPAEIVPVLGLGFDVELTQTLRWGAIARYWPLFGSGLLSNPALATLGVRFSVCTVCR